MTWDLYNRILKARTPEQIEAVKQAIISRYKTLEDSPFVSILDKWKREKGL